HEHAETRALYSFPTRRSSDLMLFIENGAGKSIRLQGAFVSDEEIERVTNHARSIAEPNYLFEQDQLLEKMTIDEEEDELLQDVIDRKSTRLNSSHVSISYAVF